MNDSAPDSFPEKEVDDDLDRGMEAAFPRRAPDAARSIVDLISRRSGMRPRVSLREEPSGHGERPLKPLTGSDSPVPPTTGRYQVQGEIARGGVGAVFKSHDSDLGRDVAMKLLLEQHAGNPDVLRRFVEEAQIGGQLQHPGIVPVYDLGLLGERPYFTMKLIRGRTLASLLEDLAGPREQRRRLLGIFEQVCQTMAYAHSRGVIHRDLKPANIMVGSFGEVQVVDWGMGKVLPRGGVADEARTRRKSQVSVIETIRSDKDGSKSLVGSVMGTPAYMPPEQANGAVEQMDERSDVFSLGAVLCEILTGQPPYGGDAEETLAAAANADLEECRERLSACEADAELIALARDCLMPGRAARPRDASKLAQRLADHLVSLEDRARQAQIEAAEQRVQAAAARRSQRLTVALAASILALLTVAGGAFWWIDREHRQRQGEASASIEQELSAAAEAYGQAQVASPGDLTFWTQAVAAAERARSLLSTAAVGPELDERVGRAVQRYRAGRNRATEIARQQQMTLRLEQIGEPPENTQDTYEPFGERECERRDAGYREAFLDYGLPLEEMDLNDAAVALDDVEDLLVWLTAVDDWALVQEVLHGTDWPSRRHLLEIAAAVDENPLRLRLRDLLFSGAVSEQSLAVLVQDPGSGSIPATVALSLASRLQQLEAYDLQYEVLSRAQREHPDSFVVAFQLAEFCRLLARNVPDRATDADEDALRFYTVAASLRPDHLRSHLERGKCEDQMERWDDAMATYRHALELDPEYIQAHEHMALVLRDMGDRKAEAEQYLRVLEIDPDHFHILNSLANALIATGNAEKARAILRGVKFRNPDRVVANYPVVLEMLGDEEGALREYRWALEREPDDKTLHNNLAWRLANSVREELRDPEEALFHARRAVELDPKDANSRETLGAALYRAGAFEEAVGVLEDAAGMAGDDPRNVHTYLFLALARHELGQEQQAASAYRVAAEKYRALGNERGDEDLRLYAEAQAILGTEKDGP